MGKLYAEIDDRLRAFIAKQHMFFVASAPTGPAGQINCSPKGLDTFRILSPTRVAYLDFVGSGVETIAHLRQNGRVVLMFCAFEGAPKIVRLHGRGEVVTEGHRDFAALAAVFPPNSGTRAFIRVDVTRVSDSCGYSVPLFEPRGQRDALDKWATAKGPEGLCDYRAQKNARSLDGLPVLPL